MNRVVITGMSVVSPIGSSVPDFMAGLSCGRRGIGLIRSFNSDYLPSKLGAEVKDVPLEPGLDKKVLFLHRALAELLADDGPFERYAPAQRVLSLGSGVDYLDLPGYVQSGGQAWPAYLSNCYQLAYQVAAKYAIRGGTHVNVSACVAANQALGLSYRMLKQQGQQLVIAGGVDSMLNPLGYLGFYKLGALSNWSGKPEESCRPFDKNRCGVVLGEGAALLLLQTYAEADPARILAEIVGYSTTMDAYLVTDPEPSGACLAQAALNAIGQAGLTPADIDCVHLHGTGTLKNDRAESKAMHLIFGDRYTGIPVFSLKGQVGHLIGACGAVEMIAVISALRQQQVFPTVNFVEPDPEVPLRVIKDAPLDMKITHILKLNAAFGGQNAAFVVKGVDHGGSI